MKIKFNIFKGIYANNRILAPLNITNFSKEYEGDGDYLRSSCQWYIF